jgi:META domain
MMAIESPDYLDNASVGLKTMIEHLLGGDWLVVEIDGDPIDPEAPREVRFEGGRVAGRVVVNRFTGSFTLDGDTLQLGGPIADRYWAAKAAASFSTVEASCWAVIPTITRSRPAWNSMSARPATSAGSGSGSTCR